ncbi:MAG: hypothetical protein J0L94_09270 [Rhodothermia bacterium]|nr:hypothetical protein [Rhodothermia bacterium]
MKTPLYQACQWMLLSCFLLPMYPIQAQNETQITFINGTSKPVGRLFIRLTGETDWGENILSATQRIRVNGELSVTLYDWEGCKIDVQASGTDRKVLYSASGLDMCKTQTFTLGQSRPEPIRPPVLETPSPSGTTGSKLTQEQANAMLRAHNQVRADEGVKPMDWDETVATFAQEWANHLATEGCSMQHRPRQGAWKQRFGENLFMQQSTGTLAGFKFGRAVQSWADEKQYFTPGPLRDFSTYPDQVGHYTQIVWATSVRVGCGYATCNTGGWNTLLVVCNYDPPGNYIGQDPLSPKN